MRPPLISTDIAGLLSFLYLPPAVTLTLAFFHFLPLTSMPCFFNWATAALARSARYAAFPAGFLIAPNCFAVFAVRAYAALSMIPMPSLFVNFVRTDLQNPDPPGWVCVFLEDHPSALARVEQIEGW